MTIDEAIEIFKDDIRHQTLLNMSDLRSDELVVWLEELKAYRLFKEKCKQCKYTVHSELFAEHIEEYLEQLKEQNNE